MKTYLSDPSPQCCHQEAQVFPQSPSCCRPRQRRALGKEFQEERPPESTTKPHGEAWARRNLCVSPRVLQPQQMPSKVLQKFLFSDVTWSGGRAAQECPYLVSGSWGSSSTNPFSSYLTIINFSSSHRQTLSQKMHDLLHLLFWGYSVLMLLDGIKPLKNACFHTSLHILTYTGPFLLGTTPFWTKSYRTVSVQQWLLLRNGKSFRQKSYLHLVTSLWILPPVKTTVSPSGIAHEDFPTFPTSAKVVPPWRNEYISV